MAYQSRGLRDRTSYQAPCLHCGEMFPVQRYRFETAGYCSIRCQYLGHERGAEVVCRTCGMSFFVNTFRRATARYCSRPCYYKAMTRAGSVELVCSVCGVTFRRPPSRAGKYPRACCSVACRSRLRRTDRPGSPNTYRAWMLTRGRPTACTTCGYRDHPAILVIHHRDRDRQNNDPSNLVWLCPNCHAVAHLA